MTVGELKEMLDEYGDHLDVIFEHEGLEFEVLRIDTLTNGVLEISLEKAS